MKIIVSGLDGNKYIDKYGFFNTYTCDRQFNTSESKYDYNNKYTLGFTQLYYNSGVFFDSILLGLSIIRQYSEIIFEKYLGRLNRYLMIDRSVIIVYTDDSPYKDIIKLLQCKKFKISSLEELEIFIKKNTNGNFRQDRRHYKVFD